MKDSEHPDITRLLLLLFVISFAVRGLYLFEFSHCPFYEHPIVDARTYLELARNFLTGKGDGATLEKAPLYPLLLAPLLAVGFEVPAIRLCHIILGALNCCLVALLAFYTWNSRRCALFAGIIAAFYGTFVFFDVLLLPAGLQVFFYTVGLLGWVLWRERGDHLFWPAVSGVCLGLAAISHGIALGLYLPLYAALAPWHDRRCVMVFIVASLLPLVPVAIYNTGLARAPVLVSTSGGVNFYIGNCLESKELERIRPGFRWQCLINKPLVESGIRERAAQSGYFLSLALDFWRHHTGAALMNLFRKAARFFCGDEIGRNQSVYSFTRCSVVLSLLLWKKAGIFAFPFCVLFPAAVLCLAVEHRRSGYAKGLFLVFIVHAGVVCMFFVTARYRLPIIPVLIVLAARTLDIIVFEGLGDTRHPALLASVGVALALSCNGIQAADENFPVEDLLCLADSYARSGDIGRAKLLLYRVLADRPDYADAHAMLGMFCRKTKALRKARSHLLTALKLNPGNFMAWAELGDVEILLGNKDAAVRCFEKADRHGLISPAHLHNLGLLYIEKGRWSDAVRVLKRACIDDDAAKNSAKALAVAKEGLEKKLRKTTEPAR